MNTWIWRLRKTLTPLIDEPDPIETTSTGSMRLCPSVTSTDAQRIASVENCSTASLSDQSVTELVEIEAAASLSFDSLAEGCFDEWVVAKRESTRLNGLRILGALADEWIRRDETKRATALCEMLVAKDPLREDAHRRLMRLYAIQGRSRQALGQFASCCEILHDEIGVAPLPETSLLADVIESGALSQPPVACHGPLAVAATPAQAPSPGMANVTGPLEAAIEACQTAVVALMAAVELVAQDPNPTPETSVVGQR